jgi:hypothetical protein
MTALAAAALCLAASAPTFAQQSGGVAVNNSPGATLNKIEQLQPGCPVATTNVASGTNRALGRGSLAQQQVTSNAGPCRPLVSTQIGAGVNVSLGQGATANQSISAHNQPGLLDSTTVSRGVNVAGGGGSSANQGITNITGH